MTNTETTTHPISYRAVTRNIDVYARCNGINHSDSGEIVTHDRCGAQVVIREDGRIFNIRRVGAYDARKFECWHDRHECDPNLVAAADAARAQSAANGEIVKGCDVVVARGRKVAKGTTGRVFWMGDRGFGLTVGLRTTDGVTHFTAAKNCDRI
jgi:hypothetical protein